MSFLPLYPHDVFGFPTGLLLGTLIGFAFGFVLERAGFGNAKNLAAQFYLTDMRVLKVMFSAIATACAGIGFLAGAGGLDLSLVTVTETFVGPDVVGGRLLGVGFMTSAYCPGTGIVAMASGKWDGLWSIVGVTIGSLAFGLVYGPLEGFYKSGAMGSVTIAQALGVPFPVVAAGVVLMAIGCFLGAEKLEAIFAPKFAKTAPVSNPPVRNRAFAVMGTLAALGLVTVALPARTPAAVAETPAARIGAVELARRIVASPQDLWILDLRAPDAAGKERIPGTVTLPEGTTPATYAATLPATRTLVAYAQGDVEALPADLRAVPGEVLVLSGGFDAWKATVLAAPQPPAEPTPALIAQFRMKSALNGYFTGAAAAPPPKLVVKAVAPSAAPKKGGGC
ncbi:MAG: YeeE/YedE family protein [Deltaproteobacteria bacterium]|nr:YeeE/YedE family protein [Deltaproteobacteria bacterium]